MEQRVLQGGFQPMKLTVDFHYKDCRLKAPQTLLG
jgi:hypothetical protein